jgi:hypothetical protein
MIYWRSCESSAFRAAALFYALFATPPCRKTKGFPDVQEDDARPRKGACNEPVLTTGFHSLALTQTLRSTRQTEHFAGGPRADRAKCGVSPHLAQMIAGAAAVAPV